MFTFENSGLNEFVLKAIKELGFETPTPVQEKVLSTIFEKDSDLLALAQTGTGKTAAFGLPIINKIDVKSKQLQALILCPTRELCVQIAKDLTNYGKFVNGLKTTAVYGGASIEDQIRSINSGTQIIAGTPGRTLDLLKRKAIKPENVRWLVLDEADEMLSMGFQDDLDSIVENMPDDRKTYLFSATMPEGISNRYLNDPYKITIGKKNSGAESINHIYYMVQARDKYLALKRIADINPDIYGIVFCRTRRETKEIAEKLISDGYNADALHGDLSQAQRDHVMHRFRVKNLQILVATDVAARGLDVENLTHVINYNLPEEAEAYIHRSGRTGRAGKTGCSVSILHSREKSKLGEIEKISGRKFVRHDVPNGKEVCEKQLIHLANTIESTEIDASKIGPQLQVVVDKLGYLTKEEILQKFFYIEFNRLLDYYKNAKDLNVSAKERESNNDRERFDKSKKRSNSGANFTRYFVNVGSKDNLNAARLIGLVNDIINDRTAEIGKIDIMKKFSFFEIDSTFDSKISEYKKDIEMNGITVVVEPSEAPKIDRREKEKEKKSFGSRRPSKRFDDSRKFDKKKRR